MREINVMKQTQQAGDLKENALRKIDWQTYSW